MNNTDTKVEARALDTKAAALYTGSSEGYLIRARTALGASLSAPRHVKVGKRRVVYLRDDLDAWLEQCRRATTSVGVA